MREAIERIITFACDHPALIGLISLVWGVLAGWMARITWEGLRAEIYEEEELEGKEIA